MGIIDAARARDVRFSGLAGSTIIFWLMNLLSPFAVNAGPSVVALLSCQNPVRSVQQEDEAVDHVERGTRRI